MKLYWIQQINKADLFLYVNLQVLEFSNRRFLIPHPLNNLLKIKVRLADTLIPGHRPEAGHKAGIRPQAEPRTCQHVTWQTETFLSKKWKGKKSRNEAPRRVVQEKIPFTGFWMIPRSLEEVCSVSETWVYQVLLCSVVICGRGGSSCASPVVWREPQNHSK